MNETPPGHTDDPTAKSLLVVAPHYDDEVLGCGGLIARCVASQAVVRVLFLTDGGADHRGDARAAYTERRRQEATAAAAVLGLTGTHHLGLPDGRLCDHLDEVGEAVESLLLSQRPDHLLITSPLEVSGDHRAAFAALHRRLTKLRPGDPLWDVGQALTILTYEVNYPQRANLLVDISGQRQILTQAMDCYASQQEQHDYLGAALGLATFRSLTLPRGTELVEAYRRLTVEDFTTRGEARLLSHLGAVPELVQVHEGPTVSVIVRTKDRPELLQDALASLAASTYGRTEVVVVNDGGQPPGLPTEFPHTLRRLDLEVCRGRAAAANAGIAAASGDFVAFLDDDDLVEPEHLATLAGLVAAPGVRVAYPDAAVGVYRLDPQVGWRCDERRLPYSRDFDAALLWFDNYIPFNTLLMERSLLAEVGDVDTSLEFFEDWDYLIRLAAKTPFHHLRQVTCEYRQFRGSGHHVLGDGGRERADFLAMKAKVIRKHQASWSVEAVARVIDQLRAEAVAEQEAAGRWRDESRSWEEEHHRLNGRVVGLENHLEVLESSERRTLEALREMQGQERQVSQDLRRAYDELERLNRLIEAMESTRAWRLHRWVEGIKGRR